MKKIFEKYKNIKKLSYYAFNHKIIFIKSIIAGVLSSVFTLAALLMGAYLTGLAFAGKSSGEISAYFPALLALVLGKGIFAYLHMLICHQMAYLVLEDLRSDIYDAIEAASPLNPVRYRTGDVSSVIMEDVEVMEAFFAHMMGDYIIAFICMTTYVIAYMFISWQAAVLSLFASIVIATVPYWFGRINQKRGKEGREKLGQTNASVVDTIQGLKEIVIFGREKKYIQKVIDDTNTLGKIDVKDGFVKGAQAGIINFVMSAVLIGVLLIGHSLVKSGSISAGNVSVLIVMAINIFIPVVMVSNTAGKINMVAASADRIYNLIQEEPIINNEGKKLPSISTDAILSIDSVGFSYEKSKKILKGINLDIKPNENIAITGPSGVGKTTLINLIMRFYDPEEGNIYLKGKNFKNMTPEEVRKNIAYVPQDVILFRGTIMDNLRLGKPDASLEEVKEAARIAVADSFIEELENGYESFVGERGLNLSGGQKQRIAIARALVTGSPILIMDEAVSNLDTESEELFRQALNNIQREKTIITIAHRRSTILESKRILVLERGGIIFDGNNKEWEKIYGDIAIAE